MIKKIDYEEVPEALKPYVAEEEKPKSRKKEIAAVVAVSIIAAVVLIWTASILTAPLLPSGPLPTQPLNQTPYVWQTTQKDVVFVNISEATNGAGSVTRESTGQVTYKKDVYYKVFVPSGVYKGHDFSVMLENFTVVPSKKIVEITNILNPNNGVIEGYMTFRIENDIAIVDIFLDEDWRAQIDQYSNKTNIFWGENLTDNTKQFMWNEISPGIYKDMIVETNVKRFRVDYCKVHVEGNVAVIDEGCIMSGGNFAVADTTLQEFPYLRYFGESVRTGAKADATIIAFV